MNHETRPQPCRCRCVPPLEVTPATAARLAGRPALAPTLYRDSREE